MFAHFFALLERVKADRKGVTALEYGIIAAVTVAAVGGVIGTVGTNLLAVWTSISTALTP